MIDPLSVGFIGLDQAVVRLAAVITDREVDGGSNLGLENGNAFWALAQLAHRKREKAIARLYEALCNGALITRVQHPVLGTLIQLSGSNWRSAAFWRDTIIGGNVHAQLREDIARYDGWSVLLEGSEFERWLAGTPPKVSVDRTAKNTPLSKQLDGIIREEIRRARKEAKAAGEKPPNRNEICKIVQPRIHERGLRVAYDQIKQIDREPEFSARQKTGVRFNK